MRVVRRGALPLIVLLALGAWAGPLRAQEPEPAPDLSLDPVVEATTYYGSNGRYLAALCRFEGITPEETQRQAVTRLDRFVSEQNIAPQPVNLPPVEDFPPAVTTSYAGDQTEAITRLGDHFSLEPADVQRLAVGLWAYGSATDLRPENISGRSCGPVTDAGTIDLEPDDIVPASGSAPYQRVCWSGTASIIPDDETREMRLRVEPSVGDAVTGSIRDNGFCTHFTRGYVGDYTLKLTYLAYPHQQYESVAVTGVIRGTIDLSEQAPPLSPAPQPAPEPTDDVPESDSDSDATAEQDEQPQAENTVPVVIAQPDQPVPFPVPRVATPRS